MAPPRAEALEERLGHRFLRPELLVEALTHPSLGGRRCEGAAFERLEFLGDRVLGLATAELLFERFPGADEGELSRRLAGLVSREALARLARGLELGARLRLGRGEARGGGRENAATLANGFEAVLGALFLDGGMEAARAFVRHQMEPLIEEAPGPPEDAKTALQEWAQARHLELPVYRVLDVAGPAHGPRFRVETSIEGHDPAAGEGATKRAAERAAAMALLARLRRGTP
jgi:ribonuclease-3